LIVLDTTYFLPIVGISVKADFFSALKKKEICYIPPQNIYLNEISLFELQAKASKLGVPPKRVIEGINAIIEAFNIISFYDSSIIKIAFKLRKIISDYIDCIIVATALSREYLLLTEDKVILTNANRIYEMFPKKKIIIMNLQQFKKKGTF